MEYRLRVKDSAREGVVKDCSVLPRQGETMAIDGQEYRVLSVVHTVDTDEAKQPTVEVAPAGERTD